MHLTMNLLIKDEADVIEQNIRVHAALGVDSFVVMDNGSTDGTTDIIRRLQSEYPITLIERPALDYQQSNWKTEMVHIARKTYGADWTIANDADEFWIPSSGSLKDRLTRSGSIIHCERRNALFDADAFERGAEFHTQTSVVSCPVLYCKGNEICDEKRSIMMGKIHGKVMVRTLGLIRVKGGNHRAWHAWGWLNQRNEPDITVYHYPIRSKSHFMENVKHRAYLLENGVTKMGNHYRRWAEMYRNGTIDKEFRRLVLTPDYKRCLNDLGIIREDTHARDVIGEILSGKYKPSTPSPRADTNSPVPPLRDQDIPPLRHS